MKKTYGIYEVSESFGEDGRWHGYTVKCTDSVGKQGKLYLQSDGREHYRAKDEDLEI
jgi:hypothetical protein